MSPPERAKLVTVGQQLIQGGLQDPQLAELSAHFIAHAGGMSGLAKLLYTEFIAANSGGLMRQRILEMVLRATKFANERAPKLDDVQDLTDEDLERELFSQVQRLEDFHAEAARRSSEQPAAPAGLLSQRQAEEEGPDAQGPAPAPAGGAVPGAGALPPEGRGAGPEGHQGPGRR